MHILKKVSQKLNIQCIIVSLCILSICIGTQQMQTVAWNTGIIEFSRDSLGVLMALILFTNYKWTDFVKYKFIYIAWAVLGALLGIILVPMAIAQRLDFLMADTIIIAAGIYLMGFCIIHTIISFFVEKYRPKLYLPLTIMWVVMLTLMITSKSDYLWPECYFILFLTYYLTPQTPTQHKNTTLGVINGLILSFILIQAHSLLFRPYDRVRYYGNFCNPNNNSVFLCFCLAAILAKILFIIKQDKGILVKTFYFLMAGACYSFICMTICRSGYLAAIVITVFFLIAYCRIREKKVFFRTGLLLISIFIATLPLTYLAVRYIPTIHPHVLFYYQEGYSTSRVHSWDARDSEKYISLQQMLEAILGRFGTFIPSHDDSQGKINDEIFIESLQMASRKDYFPSDMFLYTMAGNTAEGEEPNKIPLLSIEESKDPLLVRYTIYKWYFTRLSLRGMPYDEQGFQLRPRYWVQSTHNIYLDYGINFGYPVMIIFTVFIWWGIGRLTKMGMRNKNEEKLAYLFIALIPPVFGMFELAWGAGMISSVALYIAFKEMFDTGTAEIFSPCESVKRTFTVK